MTLQNPLLAPRAEVLIYPRDGGTVEDYPLLTQPDAFKHWFDREGYIVVRNGMPVALCKSAVQAFLHEVLQDRTGLFERHVSGKFEPHTYTDAGCMKYPIMNLQDLPDKKYPQFKKLSLDLLTQPSIQRAISILFGEPGRVVHTMYFDGNQTTWAHRDGHYIDARESGKMVGVWLAAEDIHLTAGRFFVVPRSHTTEVAGEQGDPNAPAYKEKMAGFVRNGPLDCVSPVLKRGDFILWSSMTIHGSLPTLDTRFSRRSFTAHYVPHSHAFQWKVREHGSSRCTLVNNVEVVSHSDDATLLKRLRNAVRAEAPRLYAVAQRVKNRR